MLTAIEGYHTLLHNKHKRPTPHRDVSARLILMQLESGSFDSENKRRISKNSGRSEPFGTGLCRNEIYKYAE